MTTNTVITSSYLSKLLVTHLGVTLQKFDPEIATVNCSQDRSMIIKKKLKVNLLNLTLALETEPRAFLPMDYSSRGCSAEA